MNASSDDFSARLTRSPFNLLDSENFLPALFKTLKFCGPIVAVYVVCFGSRIILILWKTRILNTIPITISTSQRRSCFFAYDTQRIHIYILFRFCRAFFVEHGMTSQTRIYWDLLKANPPTSAASSEFFRAKTRQGLLLHLYLLPFFWSPIEHLRAVSGPLS